jgi:hypothetical protein
MNEEWTMTKSRSEDEGLISPKGYGGNITHDVVKPHDHYRIRGGGSGDEDDDEEEPRSAVEGRKWEVVCFSNVVVAM